MDTLKVRTTFGVFELGLLVFNKSLQEFLSSRINIECIKFFNKYNGNVYVSIDD